MPIAQSLIPEFDREMSTTRRLLERVPEAKAEWKPHAKSSSLGALATHVANLPTWIVRVENMDVFDAATQFQPPPKFSTTAALVGFFDKNVAAAREALLAIDDTRMGRTWTFKRGEQTIMAMPRADIIRSMAFNHHVHHRGQLSVYLRLLDVPLPPMYGPTADER